MKAKDTKLTVVEGDNSLNDNKKKRRVRVSKLNSALDIRREMSLVYRKARRGEIDLNAMTAFIKALSAMTGVIREGEFEERLKKLEGK
ncbi:MAG: hypothetical protein JAZ18_15845 [Candidatus Thiodiazotropha endolucinida]|nr:hypothetical protein [Candidatus Thiodiazotropha endolucinida]